MATVDQLVEAARKEHGERVIMPANTIVEVERIPFGVFALDLILGGGIPRNRVTEIFGAPSSCKSNLANLIVASQQRMEPDLKCVWIAVEPFDPIWAKKFKVDVDKLLIVNPDYSEQIIDISEGLMQADDCGLVVLDSFAAMTTIREIEQSAEKQDPGGSGQIGKKLCNKILRAQRKAEEGGRFPTFLILNQIRHKIGVMYGCFPYQASVLLADGSHKTIGDIVNKKLPVTVMSWNKDTGLLEPKKVVSWFKEGNSIDDFSLTDEQVGWIKREFVTLVVKYPDGSGATKITCTPNHMMATPNGFVPAGEIELDGHLMHRVRQTVFSNHLAQLVTGSIFGDGCISRKRNGNAFFREEHGVKQAEYVSWKHKAFGGLAHALYAGSQRVGFATRNDDVFNPFKDRFYSHGVRYKKIQPSHLGDLGPLGLAIWFQDDGSRSDENGNRKRSVICMHAIPKTEVDPWILAFRLKFGLFPSVYTSSTITKFVFDGHRADAFENIIRPYAHPSMAYKFRVKDGIGSALAGLDFSHGLEEIVKPCRVFEIRRSLRYGKDAVRYNLEVEDNATYVIGETVVHNSPETSPGGFTPEHTAAMRLRLYAKDITDKTVNPALPCRKEIHVEVKKHKVPVVARECVFEMAMIPQSGLATGQVDNWNTFLHYLKKHQIVLPMEKGSGWKLGKDHFQTLKSLHEFFVQDPDLYTLLARNMILAEVSAVQDGLDVVT